MTQEEQHITTIATRMQVLHEDVTDIKSALKDLTTAITKLALIEERQSQTTLALERMYKSLENIDERVNVLEHLVPESRRASKWIDRALVAAIMVIAGFVAKKVGLM
jgi:vacuolar-type H+-ATPase subunit D/Vma8